MECVSGHLVIKMMEEAHFKSIQETSFPLNNYFQRLVMAIRIKFTTLKITYKHKYTFPNQPIFQKSLTGLGRFWLFQYSIWDP